MAALARTLQPHHFAVPPTDGSTDSFDRTHEENSTSSNDTVLSVGNEQPSSKPPLLTFRNIESHLNAISAITNSTLQGGGGSSSTRSGPGSPASSSADSSLEASYCKRMCAEAEEPHGLKFSIDNILKADFGRRITEPLRKCKVVARTASAAGDASRGGVTVGVGGGEVGAVGSKPVDLSKGEADGGGEKTKQPMLWPAWVYCTRYSDRPSSGPRTRRIKKPGTKPGPASAAAAAAAAEEKRPRTAFSGAQLARLKHEFAENRYLTERRRQQLSGELGLNEAQIKIWFQNKRAKIKKASGQKNPLALQLMAQGLYNHSTIPLSKEEEELQELHNTKINSPST